MAGQQLRGLVGQGMDGRRRGGDPVINIYPSGVHAFIVPRSGKYRLILRGAGGGGGSGGANVGGASGSLVIGERCLTKGQIVLLSVALPTPFNSDGGASSITLGANDILIAGGGGEGFTPNPAGVASSSNGLDRLFNGSLGTIAGLGNNGGPSMALAGGGAPGWDGYRGAEATSTTSQSPGAGGRAGAFAGGPGEIIVHQVHMKL